MSSHSDLELIDDLCERAEQVLLRHPGERGAATKLDGTPVTAVELEIERVVCSRLHAERPSELVLGEETGLGLEAPHQGRFWTVDPVDGTKSYLRGLPHYGFLVAVCDEDGPLASGISAPALGVRWRAAREAGAWVAGRDEPLTTSGVTALEDAYLSTGSAKHFAHRSAMPLFETLSTTASRTRSYGDFWQYTLLAEGKIDAVVEAADLHVWDWAPVKALVEASNGVADRVGDLYVAASTAELANELQAIVIRSRAGSSQG